MSNDNDAWGFWMAQLAGKNPETTPGKPHSGYYRQKTSAGKDENGRRIPLHRAVAIWWENGECKCWVSGGYRAPVHLDEIDQLFASICRNAVTYDQYVQFRETGKWFDDVDMIPAHEVKTGAPVEPDPIEDAAPPMGHNNPPETLPLYKQVEGEINQTLDDARKWIVGLSGKKVNTKEEADKAGNFAEAFARLEKKAEKTFEAEKLPHDQKVKEIRANWKPVIALAEEKKKTLKGLAGAWMIAEKQRLAEEHAKAQAEWEAKAKAAADEAAALAEKTGGEVSEPAPVDLPPPSEPTNVAVGTAGRKIAVRERTVYTVTDYKAFCEYVLRNVSPFPAEFTDALDKIGRRLGPQLTTLPPGLAKETKEEVA